MTGADAASLPALLKVNLTLDVGPVRADGYHPLSSVCVFAPGGDVVRLGSRADAFALSVTGPEASALAGLPPAANLVLRAAEILAATTPLPPRQLILDKRVPAAGGVAGGTADAAAALVLLNRTAPRPLTDDALIALSRRLGADGPVCTAARAAGGGVWVAEGDGDRVRGLGAAPPGWLVLVNPRREVPTGSVFSRFDEAGGGALPLDQPTFASRALSALAGTVQDGRNDLRPPALSLAPVIAEVEAFVANSVGCLCARMSGSGASVFGLFAGEQAARRAARRAQARGWWATSAALARG